MNFSFEPIGFIDSCYKDKFGTPRQPGLATESRAFLSLRDDLQPEQSLSGLEGFSHLWLLWCFHKNKEGRFHAKVHPPRLGGKAVGLFSTRTPHRPNPIGLSMVKLLGIEAGTLHLGGIDLIDGTPVLDIKPYLPEIESVPDATTGWINQVKANDIKIEFDSKVLAFLQGWKNKNKNSKVELRELIIQTIQLDPRPLVYRQVKELSETPYREFHAVRLFDVDVHFKFLTEDIALVFDIFSI